MIDFKKIIWSTLLSLPKLHLKEMLCFNYCNKAYNKCIDPVFWGIGAIKKSRKCFLLLIFDLQGVN